MLGFGSCLVDPVGAKKETVDVARRLGIGASVAVAYEVSDANLGDECFTYFVWFIFLKPFILILFSFPGSSLSSDGYGTLEGVSL